MTRASTAARRGLPLLAAFVATVVGSQNAALRAAEPTHVKVTVRQSKRGGITTDAVAEHPAPSPIT